MLARRIGSTAWSLLKRKPAWTPSTFGVYASPGQSGALSHSAWVVSINASRQISVASAGNTAIYGVPAAATNRRIDLAGTGGNPVLPGMAADSTGPVGRYATTAGGVSEEREGTYPVAPTLSAYSALGGGMHLWCRIDAGNVARLRAMNLRTG